MFEAAINRTLGGRDPAGGLRALDWHELVARLAAAREVRAVIARAPGSGSFAPHSAAGLSASDGEPGVNLDALACSKWPEAMIAGTAPGAATGDREQR